MLRSGSAAGQAGGSLRLDRSTITSPSDANPPASTTRATWASTTAEAIKQLDATRPQDYARVFLPGADQEMAKAVAEIVTQQADVKASMTKLKGVLEGIYASQVKGKI